MRTRSLIVLAVVVPVLFATLVGCPPETVEDPGPAALDVRAECIAVARDADDEARIVVTVRAQGPDREAASQAAQEAAALWWFGTSFSDSALATLREDLAWTAELRKQLAEHTAPVWTDADAIKWRAGSGFVDATYTVAVDALAAWLATRALDPRVADVPIEAPRVRIAVVPMGGDGTDSGEARGPEASTAETELMSALRDFGAGLIDYSKELEAVRSIIGNVTAEYGFNDLQMIPADVLVQYSLTESQVRVRATMTQSGELLGEAVGEGGRGTIGVRIKAACDDAIARVWADIEAARRAQVQRGHLFVIAVRTGGDAAANAAIRHAAREISNVHCVEALDAATITLSVWVSDDLPDSNQVFRALRDACVARECTIKAEHLSARFVIASLR